MKPAKVSQPALSKRLLTFPAELFQQVLFALLPKRQTRWQARNRPLSKSVGYALVSFEHIYVTDGSTLEALFRKLDALQDSPVGVLAGKICTDLTSVLDPAILPANIAADLYRRRWRIEKAFQTVKRLLNLSCFWTGSLNGILAWFRNPGS